MTVGAEWTGGVSLSWPAAMADTLEIRLGGQVAGRPITTRDLDYSDVHPFIGHIELAALIEARLVGQPRPKVKNRFRPLGPVRLALVAAALRADLLIVASALQHQVQVFLTGDPGCCPVAIFARLDARLISTLPDPPTPPPFSSPPKNTGTRLFDPDPPDDNPTG